MPGRLQTVYVIWTQSGERGTQQWAQEHDTIFKTYYAGIDKGIFESFIAREQMLPQDCRIPDILEEGHVDRPVDWAMLEAKLFDHGHDPSRFTLFHRVF